MAEIIAEIGQNHNGDMALARKLIKSAKANGADVAKFQVFDAKALFEKNGNPWYEYNCKSELSRDDVLYLADQCRKEKIEFMASVFDVERLRWLEEAGVSRYKIASRSVQDRKLIDAVIQTKKPLIVSLGFWKERALPDIQSAAGVSFLYCVSEYPAELENLKLGSIDLKKYAGFSDHTIGITASLVALSRGAGILEKHFTLDKNMYGPDHRGSMIPDELSVLNRFRLEIERCL